jgi:hypothetical protein
MVGATLAEAVLARMHCLKIYGAAVQSYNVKLFVDGVPGYYLQLVLGDQAYPGDFPAKIDNVPLVLISQLLA